MQQLCCLRDAVYTPVGTYLCSLIHSPYSLNCIILLTHLQNLRRVQASAHRHSPALRHPQPGATPLWPRRGASRAEAAQPPVGRAQAREAAGAHARPPARRPRVRYERRAALAWRQDSSYRRQLRRLSVCVADPVLVSGELRRGGAVQPGGAGVVSPRG